MGPRQALLLLLLPSRFDGANGGCPPPSQYKRAQPPPPSVPRARCCGLPPPRLALADAACIIRMGGRYAESSVSHRAPPEAACEPQDGPSNQMKSNAIPPTPPYPPPPTPPTSPPYLPPLVTWHQYKAPEAGTCGTDSPHALVKLAVMRRVYSATA